jgi:hypothetical protein
MNAPLRRLVASATSLAFVLVGYLAMALPVAACSCMGPEPMAAYVGSPERAIFSGTVQAAEPVGTPVIVTRWFQGEGAAGIVWIKGEWGQGGASCETPLPPAGTEWIFVASRFEGELAVNLCTPHAAVGSDAGAAMLADAIATFGDGGGGGAPPGESPPPAAPVQGAGGAAVDPMPIVLTVGLVAAAGLVAGALLVVRGRRGAGPAA